MVARPHSRKSSNVHFSTQCDALNRVEGVKKVVGTLRPSGPNVRDFFQCTSGIAARKRGNVGFGVVTTLGTSAA